MLMQLEGKIDKAINKMAKALEIIAECQLKQTQIIEQSFKENKKEAKEAERRYKEAEEIISG